MWRKVTSVIWYKLHGMSGPGTKPCCLFFKRDINAPYNKNLVTVSVINKNVTCFRRDGNR